jgi:hypothetical protein
VKYEILEGVKEWRSISRTMLHVLKIDSTKFFSCPIGCITKSSWQILRMVNDLCGAENCEILHMPFEGTYFDQPPWFLDAVRIVRQERARHRKEEFEKRK